MKKTLSYLVMILASSLMAAERPAVPSSPSSTWKAPADAAAKYETAKPMATAAPIPPNDHPLTLAEIVDYALSNNPATRTSWLEARSAAEELASRQSQLLPTVDVDAALSRGRSTSGRTQSAFTPGASLNYLLFDFGGRAASIRDAREAVIAAGYTHNATLQRVILEVERGYFDYLANRSLFDAQQKIVEQFKTNLSAAEERHRAGVATIADVLQARTALSQAQLNYESAEGSLRVVEGSLATALGIPASTPMNIGEIPADLPVVDAESDMQAMIAAALASRPDLAASRSEISRAEARIDEVRSSGLPTVNVAASAGRNFFAGSSPRAVNDWSTALLLRFPLFTGFRITHELRQAELQRDIAREQTRALEQRVNLEVWSSYYAVRTAGRRVQTSKDLLASARQSSEVARARYREGLGSILDLLTAESALANATAQEIGARADWLQAVAQLAHDIGTLTTAKLPGASQ